MVIPTLKGRDYHKGPSIKDLVGVVKPTGTGKKTSPKNIGVPLKLHLDYGLFDPYDGVLAYVPSGGR
ncbi:MAG: hypothetical protein ACE5GD_10990 [Candidatus Geothermarchaeales archaeon]